MESSDGFWKILHPKIAETLDVAEGQGFGLDFPGLAQFAERFLIATVRPVFHRLPEQFVNLEAVLGVMELLAGSVGEGAGGDRHVAQGPEPLVDSRVGQHIFAWYVNRSRRLAQ